MNKRLAPGTVQGPFKKKRTWLARNRGLLILYVIAFLNCAVMFAIVGFALGYLGGSHG